MSRTGKEKRRNINFRQTPREFASRRQTQVFLHFNRNLPYKVYQFSRRLFERQMTKISGQITRFVEAPRTKGPRNLGPRSFGAKIRRSEFASLPPRVKNTRFSRRWTKKTPKV